MTPGQFVWDNVFRSLKDSGVSDSIARDQADIALDDFNKSKIPNKASGLIKDHIKTGKRRKK